MSDLTDKMRTCAARIIAITRPEGNDQSINDAPNLLLEAANLIEKAPELPPGEPMEIIPPSIVAKAPSPDAEPVVATWYSASDTLPASPSRRPHKQACPKCESTAVKRVLRHEGTLFVACPVCAAAWPYRA